MKGKTFFYTMLIFVGLFLFGCEPSSQDIIADVSGVWRADSDGAMVSIDLLSSQKNLLINEIKIPTTIAEVDTDNLIISLNINYNGQNVIWTIRQLYDDANETFTIYMTFHDGTQEDLSFVRNL